MMTLGKSKDMNSDIEVRLRKVRNNLELAGKGYIFFGIWNVIKLFMTYTMQPGLMDDLVSEMRSEGLNDAELKVSVILTFALISVFVIVMHLYIGAGAIKYARGTSRKKGYTVMSVIGMVFTVCCLPLYFTGEEYGGNGVDETDFASVLVDLTMIFIFVDILYLTHMIKKHSARADDRGGVV